MLIRAAFVVTLLSLQFSCAIAQNFTKITDSTNPIVSASGSGAAGYSGASWMDYDNDGDIDLFACPDHLYKNNGNGSFTEVLNHGIGAGLPHAPATGVTWADMDNDGDLDCMYSGAASVLYRNNGKDSNFSFTSIKRGAIASVNNRGWAGAWGDFDNDGFVDMIITHPRGFVGTPIRNPFFRNLGAGEFSKIVTGDVVKDLAPYTVATWYDYDFDGDEDLFIGSGPAGTPARDYIFKNLLKESGSAILQRINDGILGTDLVDGQVWNWIDYDNDGDLDAYLTNYTGVSNNNLYRNDNGTFVKTIAADVGPIVSSNRGSLSNIWIDFDNDGDLDCYVTRDSARTSQYFSNNGNGTFIKIDSLPMVKNAVPHIAAVAGDYDDDGDMDLFVVSGGSNNELYRNDQSASNNWLKVNVKGFPLNRSAIGAKVKMKATINGKLYWQFREITAQNSFNGHNSMIAHFGLGNATVADSVIIEWLSGSKSTLVNVPAKQLLNITENGKQKYLRSVFYGDIEVDQVPFTVNFTNVSFGDSSSTPTSWKWDFNNDGIIDATTKNASFTYTKPDTYSVKLIISDGITSDTLVRQKYIIAKPLVSVVSINTVQHHFGTIDVNTEKRDTTITIYNLGKGTDSIFVSLKYGSSGPGTVKPDSALSISTKDFFLAAYDSQKITFTIFPRKVTRTNLTITYTPVLIITSKNNDGKKVFEKDMYSKLSGTLMGVDDSELKPRAFSLSQNYPNPFNPSTIIQFQIPEKNMVTMILYDAIGREAKRLISEERDQGEYSFSLNGEGLSSGLYYYTLRTGSYSETKKLMLLK